MSKSMRHTSKKTLEEDFNTSEMASHLLSKLESTLLDTGYGCETRTHSLRCQSSSSNTPTSGYC